MKFISSTLLLIFSCIYLNAQVVINEIYGGGGNAGSVFKNDFIELYNSGNSAVSLNGWSIQYTSKTGTSWSVTPLSGTIPAKGFFLIQQASGSQGSSLLPTPDVIGNIAMAASDGKVALVKNATALTGSCPKNQTSVADFVGYGGADCADGNAAPAPNNINSIERNPAGINTHNNSNDFVTGAPTPSNKNGIDVTPPQILSKKPVANATNISTSFMASITFDEEIKKGTTGSIIVKRVSDQSVVENLLMSNDAVFVESATLFFPLNHLDFMTTYSIEISAGAISDLFQNSGNAIDNWIFTTGSGTPKGTLNIAYDFNSCGNVFNYFTAYNVSGNEQWGCTAYGLNQSSPESSYPFEGALTINGFGNTTNHENEDWLISPSFDLSATTYPVLSFWSKTTAIGAPLKLKVSKDYPGYGNPNNYTWTTINGYFPEKNSKTWTLSEFISLENFKSDNTHFAFVYNSTPEGAAQWSLDNVILQNLYAPPPPVLNLRKSKIKFEYVPVGRDSIIQLKLTPHYLLGDIFVNATSNFLISSDGVNFSSSIQFLKNLVENTAIDVYIKFSPSEENKDYQGQLVLTTQGAQDAMVALTGSSINYDLSLEVVNWNLEWFGINNTSYGPVNKDLQETNVKTIVKNIGADIYAFVEVVSEPRLKNVVASLNDEYGDGAYDYVICDYGSYSNPYKSGTSPLDQLQKEAFVYKTSVIQPIDVPKALVTEGPNTQLDTKSPAYSYFSSGRYPYMLHANVTLGGETKPVRFVLLHGKANTNPIETAYYRRKNGADTLNYTLNHLYPDDHIILLGDFNDDLPKSITYGFTESSYSIFNNDSLRFYSPTYALSVAGYQSTVGYKSVIDHVELSNEMKPHYIPNSAKVLTEVTNMVSNYGSTTTDHYPILTRYAWNPVLPLKLISFNVFKQGDQSRLQWFTADEENTNYFEIQKSTDAKNWLAVGNTPAQGGGDNSYQFTDKTPFAGVNYYRLKMIDKDGKFSFSPIKSITFQTGVSVNISPNPAHSIVSIEFGKDQLSTVDISVMDITGKIIFKTNTNTKAYTLNVSQWSKGLYIIQIKNGGSITNHKLLVQ